MNSSLDKLVKNLSDKVFKFFLGEISEFLKRKIAYPNEYMNSLERFREQNLSAKQYFHSSTKDGKIGWI